jgi:phosphoenolpyruvate carboxylase
MAEQCNVSLKKINNMKQRINEYFKDDLVVEEVMNIVMESLNFDIEKHKEHIKKLAEAARLSRSSKIHSGLSTYSEFHKQYYLSHKNEINKKNTELKRKITEQKKKAAMKEA